MKNKYLPLVAIFWCFQSSLAHAQNRVQAIVRDGSIEAPVASVKSNGLNISSQEKEVFSISNGTVISSITIDGLKAVLIRSADSTYVYANMTAVSVSEGDILKTGQKIGELSHPSESLLKLDCQVSESLDFSGSDCSLTGK